MTQPHPIKAAIGTMSHYDICVFLHACYMAVNGAIQAGRSRAVTPQEWEDRKAGEKGVLIASNELRKRGLRFQPVYEVLWRLQVNGEDVELWTPYHAVKPHPRFASGAPTRNNMISNFTELENALEARRPGMSKEPRSEAKFVRTRERAPWK